jgi:hypothetical protein
MTAAAPRACESCGRATRRDGAALAIHRIYTPGPLQGRWTCLHCYLARHAPAMPSGSNPNSNSGLPTAPARRGPNAAA